MKAGGPAGRPPGEGSGPASRLLRPPPLNQWFPEWAELLVTLGAGWPHPSCQDAIVSMTTEVKQKAPRARVVSSSETKSPRPRRAPGGGILLGRRWRRPVRASLGRRRAPPGGQAPGSALCPSRHPARLSPGGVLSCWVGPHSKAGREKNAFAQTSFFLSCPQTSQGSPSIPTRPRLAPREGPRAPPSRSPGPAEVAQDTWCQGNRPGHWGA